MELLSTKSSIFVAGGGTYEPKVARKIAVIFANCGATVLINSAVAEFIMGSKSASSGNKKLYIFF